MDSGHARNHAPTPRPAIQPGKRLRLERVGAWDTLVSHDRTLSLEYGAVLLPAGETACPTCPSKPAGLTKLECKNCSGRRLFLARCRLSREAGPEVSGE